MRSARRTSSENVAVYGRSDISVPQAFVDDPPPVPPRKPLPEECCGIGCDPCIFDRYAEVLTKYQAQFAEWQARRGRA